jgi:hypothetical protein
MADLESESAIPMPTDHAAVGQTPLQFIDEMERKQNPKSHLRLLCAPMLEGALT